MLRLAMACLFLLAACTSRPREDGWRQSGSDASEEAADYRERQKAEYPAPRMAKSMPAASIHAGSGMVDELSSLSFSAAPPSQSPSSEPQIYKPGARLPAEGKRMVHYSGAATLRSTEPERILDSAIDLVTAAGGYLENRTAGYAALRVPSAGFDSMFARLLRLAEVIDYRQQAEDITEAVQDTDLRLKVVVATLERLEDLIKKARTESQKLRLLKELKRFREEKEVLEAQRRDLVQRARFASIQIWVQTHSPTAAADLFSRDLADFRWIHRLSPFDDGRFRGRPEVKFSAPAGMVVTDKRHPWRATSSQGAEFWGSQVDVDLLGDSRFWREAIRSRMEPGFKASDTARAGEFLFCRFQSFGPTPYFYWVGVRSRGDELDVAEFYFPGEEQQAKLLPGLLSAVEGKPR